MYEELVSLVRREEDLKSTKDFDKWRWKGGRKEKLDQLYSVRETFSLKLDEARYRLDVLLEEEEEQRRTGVGGLQALDLDSHTLFAVDETINPTELLGIAPTTNNYAGFGIIEEEEEDDFLSTDSEDDEDSFDVDEDDINQNSATELLSPFNKKKKKRSSAAKRHRKTLTLASREALERKKILNAKEEEEEKSNNKNKSIKLSEAEVVHIEKRLETIDTLLESLQDEEWADEIQIEEEGFVFKDKEVPNNTNTNKEFLSLLDQILAMILGSTTSNNKDIDDETEFLQLLRKEHAKIVEEWFKYFGRLPPSTTSTETTSIPEQQQQTNQPAATTIPLPSSECLRAELGITDVDSDWDQDDDNDDIPLIQLKNTPSSGGDLRPGCTSLRPGGKIG